MAAARATKKAGLKAAAAAKGPLEEMLLEAREIKAQKSRKAAVGGTTMSMGPGEFC